MYKKIVDISFGSYVAQCLYLPVVHKVAFVLSDGRIIFCDPDSPHQDKADITTAHRGSVLCASLGIGAASVLSGGDDGMVVETDSSGQTKIIDMRKGKWRDPVIVKHNIIASAAGKDVLIKSNEVENILSGHPSTVTGIALNNNAKRIAVAHYGGVSVWYATIKEQTPKKLVWKGSHINVIFSPDDKFVMTGTQENMLHGWFLKDGRDFEMAGYPSKIKSMGWSCDGKYLCTSGADTLIAWDFSGAGPMGRYPLEVGERGFGYVTRVACHPVLPVIALGHESGALMLAHLGTQQAVMLRPETSSGISALCWSENGDFLIAGCSEGLASILDFR